MESCLYEGVVRHERYQPVSHSFRYRLFLAYLDLAELPSLVRARVVSARRFAPASFVRGDHFGDPARPLDDDVRDLVRERTGVRPGGPIRLLTHLRYLGYYFSPLNLFFCFERDGRTVSAIVAEVQNTPWLERHCYVLWDGNRQGKVFRHPKAFHVSPFMSMNLEYVWRLTAPGKRLGVAIANETETGVLFRAGLSLARRPLSRRSLWSMQWRYPLITARVSVAIYTQALRLWRKKCPFCPHPKHPSSLSAPASQAAPPHPGFSIASSAME